MNAEQLDAMQEGRERARRQRRDEASFRVSSYRAWLQAGSKLDGSLPPIPSDAEWKMAEGAR